MPGLVFLWKERESAVKKVKMALTWKMGCGMINIAVERSADMREWWNWQTR